MKVNKRVLGLLGAILVCAVIFLMPQPAGLSVEGQRCLGLSLMLVICWATGVAQPGYISALYMMLLVLFKVGPATLVFSMFTKSMMYMIIGGFLIAAAVNRSGLGKRVAYLYILKFASNYKGLIIGSYVLNIVLSPLIPAAFPRAFLIVAVMNMVSEAAGLTNRDRNNLGLAVFAASASSSLVFMTGDSMLNLTALNFTGINLGWFQWVYYMTLPGLVITFLMMLTQMLVYKPDGQFNLNKEIIRTEYEKLGPVSAKEKKTLFWIALAIVLWSTNSFHGIDGGWIALGAAICMALPVIGDILTPADWGQVNVGTLLFCTAASTVGVVGGATGMNEWIASLVLPAVVPANPFIFILLISVVAVVLHMCLGSVMAIVSVLCPILVGYAAAAGWSPLVPALVVLTVTSSHWLLPFHSMNILIGLGDAGGGYSDKDALKMGIPLTLVVIFVAVCVMTPWWMLTGLI